MPQSDSIAKIAPAFLKAQKDLGAVTKDAKNPHFKSSYVKLPDVQAAVHAAFHPHDIFVIQTPIMWPNFEPALQTTFMHVSGEFIADEGQPLRPTKLDPQGYGGAITYACRYGMAAVAGLRQEDDDGNLASSGPAPTGKPSWAK